MALSQRQTILYTDEFDIYKPVGISDSSGVMPHNDVKGLRYPPTPTYSAAKGYRRSIGQLGRGDFYGRQDVANTTANTDPVSFDSAQDVDVNYCLQLKNTDDPDYLVWFIVIASRDVNNFMANKRVVRVRKTTKPPGVT